MNNETVKPGYKKTEAGVIPEDWDISKIKNIASITTGKKNTQDKIEDGEYPFFVRSSIIEKINSYSFDGEAVLTAGDGVGTGKVFHYINGRFDFHQRVYKISEFCSKINGYFFFLYFSNYFYNRIIAMTAKSSVDSVRLEMIADMQIPLPPLPEQTAIAAALSDTDALISSLDKLIAKKKDLKQAAMQELLTGKKRLPGFGSEKGSKKTEIVMIPKEWNVTPLPNVIWYQEGPGLRNWQFTKKGLKVINVTNLQEYGELDLLKTDRHITWDECNKKYRHFLCDVDDFVMASSGNSYCKTSMVRKIDLPLLMNTSVIRFKPLNDLKRGYMIAYLKSNYFKNQIDLLITGGAQPNFGPAHLKKILLPLPRDINEQIAIITILSDMDSEITKLEHKRNKLRMIKEGMMQELLTGRIRLV